MEETYQHEGNCDIGCDEYIKTECVIHEDTLTYLGLESGASNKEIINKLVVALENLQDQINTINNQ